MSDEFDKEILEVVKAKPGDWKLIIGSKSYTKEEIIENYGKDPNLRKTLRKMILNLKLHTLSRDEG